MQGTRPTFIKPDQLEPKKKVKKGLKGFPGRPAFVYPTDYRSRNGHRNL